MAEHNELGKKGEEAALEYLIHEGYKILETNWRRGHAEIDIIAADGRFIVIVEVKTRVSEYVSPQESVTRKKQKLLIQAADAYITAKHLKSEVRFDIVTVIVEGEKKRISHLKDAFYPTL